MTWAETGADGRSHVYARRLTPRMSIPPSDLTLPGGPASQPDPALQYDADFGWVVFTQVSGGLPRTVARHFAGSAFDPPVLAAGGGPSLNPRVALSGLASGGAVEATGTAVIWSQLRGAGFAPPARLDPGGSVVTPGPVVAVSDAKDVAVAWLAAAPGSPAVVEGRVRPSGQPSSRSHRCRRPRAGRSLPAATTSRPTARGDTPSPSPRGPTAPA